MDTTSEKPKIYQLYQKITDPRSLKFLDAITTLNLGIKPGIKKDNYYIINTYLQVHHPEFESESEIFSMALQILRDNGFKMLMIKC